MENLIKAYKQGWYDEKTGSTSTISDNDLENQAYSLGATDCINIGNFKHKNPNISDEEITNRIKEQR